VQDVSDYKINDLHDKSDTKIFSFNIEVHKHLKKNKIKHELSDTYLNEECTFIQTVSGKFRSPDDLFEIIRTYFPDATNNEIMHELLVGDFEDYNGDELFPQLYHCTSMNRLRFMYHCYTSNTEFSKINKYDSKYTWSELLNPLGIYTNKDLDEYVRKYKEEISCKKK